MTDVILTGPAWAWGRNRGMAKPHAVSVTRSKGIPGNDYGGPAAWLSVYSARGLERAAIGIVVGGWLTLVYVITSNAGG